MRLLLLLFILLSCSDDRTDLQQNINNFTRECEELAQCIGKPYEVKINLTTLIKFKCVIKYSEVTNAYLYANHHLDIEVRPDFGYNFLEPAIEVCKINKGIGQYSEQEQNVMFRYKRCVDLAPGDNNQKEACWKQYRNGDFNILDKE